MAVSSSEGPRFDLLLRMKEQVSRRPEARADFRDVVDYLWNKWSGSTPLVWFASVYATKVFDLRGSRRYHGAVMRGFNAQRRAFPRSKVYVIDPAKDGSYSLRFVGAAEARELVELYYEAVS